MSYYSWNAGPKYQEKQLNDGTGAEVAELLKGSSKAIKSHFFNKRTQSKKYKIRTLKQGEAIGHVYYSENYKNKQK